MAKVAVHNTLEIVNGVDGNKYVLLTQVVEFPHATRTQKILLSPEQFEDAVATYQKRKVAVKAVNQVLDGTDARDAIGGEKEA